MSIIVKINTIDKTNQIEQGSLEVTQRLTSQVDTASFNIRKAGAKTVIPAYDDDIEVWDGATKIFGGKVITVQSSPVAGASGIFYTVSCVDHIYQMDKILASKTYSSQTIEAIIADLISTYAPGFTVNGVSSTFNIDKIVFNQVPLSVCLIRLASVVQYDWYVDEDKDVHFFPKHINTAPFGITDINGNYIYRTLKRLSDGSQIVNTVKVRGGEYDGDSFTDSITVSGNISKTFKLPYRFSNLTVKLNTVLQDVGIDFIDDFTSDDVLYNFQEQTIRFENALSDGDLIEFTGNPKIPVFAISEDPVSIGLYGVIEKLVRDTSLESNAVARRRANAELFAFSEPIIDSKFTTYTAGLRTGMLINVDSDIQNFDDDLLIKQVNFFMRDHDTFAYDIQLISTKRFDFISLLQKIIQPDPRPGDEAETSEAIFTDTQEINIAEEINIVSAVDDEQTVTTSENYIIDPLGAGVNADYVLSPSTPSGQADTKRPGRLDISFALK